MSWAARWTYLKGSGLGSWKVLGNRSELHFGVGAVFEPHWADDLHTGDYASLELLGEMSAMLTQD